MTATYKTGTIATTNGNATVVGTGTAWVVAAVAGGMFSCDGLSVPIASITDDTHLTLDYPWPGTTGTGKSYSIMRENSDASDIVDMHDKLAALLVTLSIAGIHPNSAGTLAQRNALSLNASNDGYLFLRAELGVAFAFYRWDGTALAWVGPFPVASATTTAAGVQSIVAGSGIGVDNTNPNVPVISSTDTQDNIDTRTTLRTTAGDANRTILTTDRMVCLTVPLTAPRNWTLPAASAYKVGKRLVIKDEVGGAAITLTNTLTILPNGTDTINFAPTCVLDIGGVYVELESDGISNWGVINVGGGVLRRRRRAFIGVGSGNDPLDGQGLRYNAAQQTFLEVAQREVLTGNRVYYVRKDGSDANNGLADNAGGAFLTIQKAVDVASALDLSIYTVTINVRIGTYTENVTLKTYLGGTGNGISIVGDTVTPSNILINGGGVGFNAVGVLGVWTLQGMKIASTAANGGHGIQAANGSIVNYGQIEFGAIAGTSSHIVCFGGAIVTCIGNYTISGGAFRHWWVESGAFLQCAGRTVTLTGTPAFSNTFSYTNMGAVTQCNADTFSGAATGQRYQVTFNSINFNGGAGGTYLPGSTAGLVQTGGQYG